MFISFSERFYETTTSIQHQKIKTGPILQKINKKHCSNQLIHSKTNRNEKKKEEPGLGSGAACKIQLPPHKNLCQDSGKHAPHASSS